MTGSYSEGFEFPKGAFVLDEDGDVFAKLAETVVKPGSMFKVSDLGLRDVPYSPRPDTKGRTRVFTFTAVFKRKGICVIESDVDKESVRDLLRVWDDYFVLPNSRTEALGLLYPDLSNYMRPVYGAEEALKRFAEMVAYMDKEGR